MWQHTTYDDGGGTPSTLHGAFLPTVSLQESGGAKSEGTVRAFKGEAASDCSAVSEAEDEQVGYLIDHIYN